MRSVGDALPRGDAAERAIDLGVRQVREAGPTRLWRAVENAHGLWHELGEPGWERFGLTVTRDRQWVWLDSHDSDHTWPLMLGHAG